MRLPALLAVLSTAALADEPENFDAFLQSGRVVSLSEEARALPGYASSVEPRLGVPAFFWAVPPAPGTPSPRSLGLTAEQAARRHLFSHAALYRLPVEQLAGSALVHLHDTGVGAVIASFERRERGLAVFRDRLHVAMTRELELVALSGYLSPAPLERADFRLTASTALAVATLDLSGRPLASAQERGLDQAGFTLLQAEGLAWARARKVLYALPRRLVPAWHVELDLPHGAAPSSSSFAYVLSAEDGALLSRKNLTEADAFTYRVWAQQGAPYLPDDSPYGTAASPHPVGARDGVEPPFVTPQLVTLQNAPLSTNDPWLPPGAAVTNGNNVDAYADVETPDGFSGVDFRASTTGAGTFDRTYDVLAAPDASQAQQMAGVTQLFFDLNVLHDWFYDRGFDERAGNAQESNFSRGGAGNDSIKAEAQDFGGLDNANMSTPADGARPRMQMYVWAPAGAASLVASPGNTSFPVGTATFGPQQFSVSAAAVVAATDGCGVFPASPSLAGKVALIDRGTCGFATKVQYAQNAGAVAVVLVNTTTGTINMAGTSGTITIPTLSVSQASGATLKAAIAAGAVTLTLSRAVSVRRAGELDNAVVAHEWGHYLSNRLVSNAAGLGTNQARSLGEGWGDTLSLLLLVRAEDAQVAANANWAGVYAPSSYASGGLGKPDANYFGMRRYPYSTDLAKNPLTFRHVEQGVALPTGVPAAFGGDNAEVHNSGEVWAVTLWECYAALLRDTARFTFDQARDRWQRTLVASLKLTPTQPTFTEARDAVLAAALANDVADFRLFSAAFARRGLGLRAVSPNRASTTHAGVVEDFTTGNELQFVSATLDDEAGWCDRDGVLDVGESGRLRLTLTNIGLDSLGAITGTLSSASPGVVIDTPTLRFTAAAPFARSTAEGQLHVTGLTAPTVISLEVTWFDPALTPPTPRTKTLSFRVHTDATSASSGTDDAETALMAWSATKGAAPLSQDYGWTRRELASDQHTWFGVDAPSNADLYLVSPALSVATTGSFGFTLVHRWDFEADATTRYDGAVVELSTNGGTSWTDVGATAAGYTGVIGGSGNANPLNTRAAWVGTSAGYPAFTTTAVDLGTTYAGQTVQVRLRVGTDQAAGNVGWDVDSISFAGITNTPFPTLVTDRAQCINRPPVARGGADFAVDERELVTLSAAASTDADGDALTARWTQVSGSQVTLTNDQFTAPEVTGDAALEFELVVNDGALDSPTPDRVVVTVRNVNRAPTADAGVGVQVNEGASVTLSGSGSDPDGDALTYQWVQLSGPAGTFSDPTRAAAEFQAPSVSASTELTLALVASDGQSTSAASQVTVTVLDTNSPPSAVRVTPARVNEREQVTLTAEATDPDGDALLYTWRQLGGPPVQLMSAAGTSGAQVTLTAPEVETDTPLVLEVGASDGSLTALTQTLVLVVDVNRPPVAVVTQPGAVKAGQLVELDASNSTDEDGDERSFAWAQVEGSPVSLGGAEGAVARFTAPASGALSFRVTVTDAKGAVDTADVQVTVEGAASGCGCSSGGELFGALVPWVLLLTSRRRRARQAPGTR